MLAALCGTVALFNLGSPLAALAWVSLGALFLWTRQAKWVRTSAVVPLKISGASRHAEIHPDGSVSTMGETIPADVVRKLLSRMQNPVTPHIGLWYKAGSTAEAVALVDRLVALGLNSAWKTEHSVDGEHDVCVSSYNNGLLVFPGGRHDLRGFKVVSTPDELVEQRHLASPIERLRTEPLGYDIEWEWASGLVVGCQRVDSVDAVRVFRAAVVWAELQKGRGTEPLLGWMLATHEGLVLHDNYVASYHSLVAAAERVVMKEPTMDRDWASALYADLMVHYGLRPGRRHTLQPIRVMPAGSTAMTVGVGCTWVTDEQALSAARVALDRGSDLLPFWERRPPIDDEYGNEPMGTKTFWHRLLWGAASLPLSLVCTLGVMIATPIRRRVGLPHPMEKGVSLGHWADGLTPVGKAWAVCLLVLILGMLF